MNSATRACPVCLSEQRTPKFQNRMAMLDGMDMSYQVAQCQMCGFAYADCLPSPGTYENYYRALSKYDLSPQVATISPADRMRFDKSIDLVRRYCGPQASIADLGCGAGALLHALQCAGWSRLAGLDPAPSAPGQAKKLFNLDCVHFGSLHQASTLLDLSDIDVVCLTGVLEHLPRLRENLELLAEALHPHATILIEVPAAERFSRPPLEPFGEFSLEHIQYFTADSLSQLFSAIGFTARSVEILDLPPGYCDSLFGVFSRNAKTSASRPEPRPPLTVIDDYIDLSESLMQQTLSRIAACSATTLTIYGAGSHTARLLPRLQQTPTDKQILTIVDSNPNLQGKKLGGIAIEAPEMLSRYPGATILVSSFRSQDSIASMLRQRYTNPILPLY